MATIKQSVAGSKDNVTIPPKQPQKTQPKMKYLSPRVIHVARCTKLRTVGTELMRQMIPEGRNENSTSQQTRSVNNPYPPRPPSQKTEIAAPKIWGKSRREGVNNRGPLKQVRKRFFNRMQRRTYTRLATSLERRHDTQTQCQTPRRSNTTTLMDNGIA